MRDRIDELSVTAAGLQPLTDLASVDALLSESRQRPTVLFKHSPTCGISAHVHHDLMPLASDPQLDADWYVISVRAHRDVSDYVAERTGITHESPQVIVLRDGKPAWNASLFDITAAALREQVGGGARA